jgi:O-acetyl-ADP-ribose deacetylase (regulator of RNase III)
VTGAGDLRSKGVKYIFHAVGPIWMKVRMMNELIQEFREIMTRLKS